MYVVRGITAAVTSDNTAAVTADDTAAVTAWRFQSSVIDFRLRYSNMSAVIRNLFHLWDLKKI